jgi:hypothetical protein
MRHERSFVLRDFNKQVETQVLAAPQAKVWKPIVKGWWRKLFGKPNVPSHVQKRSVALLEVLDDPSVDVSDESLLPSPQPHAVDGVVMTKQGPSMTQRRCRAKGDRYVAAVAKEARVEFGMLDRTKANRMIVYKFVRDRMREHHHRTAHIVRDIEICVDLVFTPTIYDIERKQRLATDSTIGRHEAVKLDFGKPGFFRRLLGERSSAVPEFREC